MLLKLRRLPNPLLLKRWLKPRRLLQNRSQLLIVLTLVILSRAKDLVKSQLLIPQSLIAQLSQTVLLLKLLPKKSPLSQAWTNALPKKRKKVVLRIFSVHSRECPAEEEEEGGAPDILGAFKEALGTIPENLSEVFGSLTDILGTSGELEAQNAAELKKVTLDKILDAKAITCEEYASIETFSEDEGADKAREEVFAKLAAAGLTLSEDEIGALEEGDLSETADIYANLRSYFHNPDKNGNPVDGFNWQVFAFLIFILLYVPCLAAMGVVVREIGLGLGVLMAVVQTILAWAVAVLLYQVPVGGNVFWIVSSIIVLVATFVFLKLFGMSANKKGRFED